MSRRAVACGVLVAGMIVLFMPSLPAGAAAPIYTWTGAGTTTNWSEGANWVGGVAPTSGQEVNLIFPDLNCPNVCNSTNDLTGLVVDGWEVTNSATGGYEFSGNAIVLGVMIDSGPAGSLTGVGIPITLGASPLTWSVTGANLAVSSVASGGTLNVDMAGGATISNGN